MTIKISVEVYTGDYFGKIITLCKNYSQMLVILPAISFKGIGWTRLVIWSGFHRIDPTVLQNIRNFCFRYFPAIHPATGVTAKLKPVNIPLK